MSMLVFGVYFVRISAAETAILRAFVILLSPCSKPFAYYFKLATTVSFYIPSDSSADLPSDTV
jgi:hypothetical protein